MRIGFVGLLQLLFIAAKLFGAITWAWPVVLLPLMLWVVGALATITIAVRGK